MIRPAALLSLAWSWRAGIAAVALMALAADAVTKILLHGEFSGDPLLFADSVGIRIVHNSGAAFGIAAGAPAWVILGLASAGSLVLAAAAITGALGRRAIPAGLMIGGAAGNILDRAGDGSVVDWIEIGPWPTFNLADAFLVTGIVLILASTSRPTAANTPDGTADFATR